MDAHAVEVVIKLDGTPHEELTVLASKLMLQALGIMGGKPGAAMQIEVDMPDGECHTFGSILVRDPDVFIEAVGVLDKHFGAAQTKPAQIALLHDLMGLLGAIPVPEEPDEPLDPRRN